MNSAEFKTEAVMGLTNVYGMELMIDPEDNDYVWTRWNNSGTTISQPEKHEILHEADTGVAYFMVDEDQRFDLKDFMKVD